MLSFGCEVDWRQLKKLRDDYRAKLISKGVVDGSSKMLKLLARRGL